MIRLPGVLNLLYLIIPFCYALAADEESSESNCEFGYDNQTNETKRFLIRYRESFSWFSGTTETDNSTLLSLGYGMTELSPVCHVTPFDNIKYGSVGVLLPNLECKVSTMQAEENNLISLRTIIMCLLKLLS